MVTLSKAGVRPFIVNELKDEEQRRRKKEGHLDTERDNCSPSVVYITLEGVHINSPLRVINLNKTKIKHPITSIFRFKISEIPLQIEILN